MNNKTILLVEDEAIIAVIHKKILSRYGFNVITAGTGEKAVEIAASTPEIDLILMDINLGAGIDGTESAERILENQEIPLVFLSSHTEPEVVEKTEGITSYGYIVKNSGETVLVAAIKMAFRLFDAKLKVQGHLNQQEILVEILFELHKRMNQPFDDLMNYGIEASVKLTNSTFGFTGLLSEDESVMTIHAWSAGAMKSCAIDKLPMHFPIADAGVWGECVRERKPVIINDYDSHAGRRGYPEGHVPITNFMAVPIFDGDRITAVGAVANSSTPYEISDVRSLISLYERLWEIIRRKKSEEALRISEEKYRVLFEDSPEEYFIIDEAVIIDCNQASLSLMRCEREQIIGKSPYELSPEMQPYGMSSKEMMYDKFKEVISKGKIVFEWLHARPDGTEFWAEVSLSVISLQNRSIFFAGLRDISDKIFALSLMQKVLNRFKALLENSPSLIAIFDSAGRNIEVSKAMADVYGLSPEDLRGKTFHDLLPRKVADDFMNTINELKEGKELIIKTDIIVLNGEERFYESRLFTIDVEDGERELFGSIAIDITEKERFRLSLEGEKYFLSMLLESIPMPVFHKDIEGRYQGFNHAFEEFFGAGKDDLIGKSVFDINPPDLAAIYHQKDLELFNQGGVQVYESQVCNKSGETRDVIFNKAALTDSSGSVTGLIGVIYDTTEAIKGAEELLKTKQNLDLIFNTVPAWIWVKDLSGKYLRINKTYCKSVGMEAEIMMGKTDYELFPQEIADKYAGDDEKLFSSGKSIFGIEERYIEKSGGIGWVRTDKIIMRDSDDNSVGSIGFAVDITDRKNAEDIIKDYLKEKELLLKETHHRVKNNMNTVYGLLSIHAEEIIEPVSKNIIKDAASRVQSMMVLYDKLYRSENHHEMNANYYLPSLIDEIIRIFDSPVPVKTEINIGEIVLSARVLSALGIIINELITNSMKYAFDNLDEGLIGLSLTEKDKKVTVVYGDNGPGLPESVDFDNSTGFGMQLVKMLVKQINGTIHIIKEKGAEFVIDFEI